MLGHGVAKPKGSFTLDKNTQLLVYQLLKSLCFCVFSMNMPRTYQDWLIWRIADCMEWRTMTATYLYKH